MQYPDNNQIYFFYEGADTNPLFITMAGIEQCTGSYHMNRRQADCSVLAYVAAGSGIITENGENIPAPQGSVFLLEKHALHDYHANPRDPWLILWFNITGELFLSMLSQYRLMKRVYPAVGENIRNLFEEALLKKNLTEADQYALNLTVTEILISLYRKQVILHETGSGKFCRIRQYLESFSVPPKIASFSLSRMEQDLNMSVRQLNRLYERETGITPYEFILHRKAELAGQYLLDTALPVKKISGLLGFSDPYYFSNFFKKRYGVSPAAFRSTNKVTFFKEN